MPTLPPFLEEDFLKPSDEGGGYVIFGLRDSLKDGRYKVIRKLGVGRSSSTWLVLDSEKAGSTEQNTSDFLAAKVLTASATIAHDKASFNELSAWKTGGHGLCFLEDHFYHESVNRRHLCFITEPLAVDISQCRGSFPNAVIPPYILKPLLQNPLSALDCLHDAGIVHGNVSPKNVLLDCSATNMDLIRVVAEEPARILGEFELEGKVYPAFASQPLPHGISVDISETDAELISAFLIDYSDAQRLDQPPTKPVSCEYTLRPPEIILGGNLRKELDVWAMGCMVYELLIGRPLFDPKSSGVLRMEDDHLAQMMEISREKFNKETMGSLPRWNGYFDESGNLLRVNPDRVKRNLEEELSSSPVIEANKIMQIASFIRTCTHPDPAKRPPVDKLSVHVWMIDAHAPGNGWPGGLDQDGFILSSHIDQLFSQ